MPVYPVLDMLKEGVRSPSKRDALNRFAFRTDQRRKKFGDYKRTRLGGVPKPKGPEAMTPALLDAARKLKIPAEQATSPQVFDQIRDMGTVPQQLAKQLRTSNPKLQALLLLRKRVLGG